MADKAVTQVRIDTELYEKLKYIADDELRSINSQIEFFVKRGIESYEKDQGEINLP